MGVGKREADAMKFGTEAIAVLAAIACLILLFGCLEALGETCKPKEDE